MRIIRLTIFFFILTSICTAQEIVQLKNVSDTILNTKRLLQVSDPFDGIKTMQKLFPGKLYKLSDHNTFLSWKCKNCKPTPYTDVNGTEGDQLFPYTEGIATRLIANIDYSDSKGNQFKLLAFNHSVYDEDGSQTGRFSGGLLGVAKFVKEKNIWQTKSFQPAIAAFGSFAQSPTPRLVQIGEDQYAFTLLHENGGGGGPFQGVFYVVAGLDGKYQPIMEAYDYQLTNIENITWSSTYKVVNDNNKKYFRDIIVTTNGHYRKPHGEEEFEVDLPTEVSKMSKTKKQFNFIIEKRFSFNGKQYKIVGKPIVKYSNIK